MELRIALPPRAQSLVRQSLGNLLTRVRRASAGISPPTIEQSAAYLDGWRLKISAETPSSSSTPAGRAGGPQTGSSRDVPPSRGDGRAAAVPYDQE